VLKEYNSIVKEDYKNNSNLKVLDFIGGVVKGSNTYSVFLMNKILSKENLRTATLTDIQKIIDKDETFLRGFYTDLGMILRTKENPNQYLANKLGKEAKERGYNFSNESPLIFKLSDLELVVDGDSPFRGLGFIIKESASPFNASELSNKNGNKKFKTVNKKGIPIFDNEGNRLFYTRDNGLAGCCLTKYSNVDSYCLGLSDSNDYGRVVIVYDAEGVAPKK